MRGRTLMLTVAGIAAAAALIAWGVSSSGASQGSNVKPLPGELPAEPLNPEALRGKKVLLVGDSLAVGLKPRMKANAAASGAIFSGDAEVSTTMMQWSGSRFPNNLAAFKPDIVLISLGTNDSAMWDMPLVQKHLTRLLDAATAAGAKVYWIGTPSLPSRLKKAEEVRAMIKATGVPYFPTERTSFARSSDGIHFTPQGYSDWADAIWAWLQK